jgi:hypothetical protein
LDKDPGYTSFMALFQQDTLVIRNGMNLAPEVLHMLEQVIDDAAINRLAALPGGHAIEIVNRDAVLEQHVPLVSLPSENGTLMLPSCQLRLVPFDEVVERLKDALETFELFLFAEQVPRHRAYRRNLVAWREVDAALITKYRTWLPGYVSKDEHHDKLQAVMLYCQLAAKDGHLPADTLDAIVGAIDKPLPRPSRKQTRAKEKRHL